MVISASRRTDIPAFYAEWFMHRIRAGYCAVPNPFNPKQVSRVSLQPQEVDVIVFWTRNPRPLFPHLSELDERGFRYYFQFTLMDNPRLIDRKSPAVDQALRTFRELAEKIGPDKVIWRYDPVLFTSVTPAEFHLAKYSEIAASLGAFTKRSVISLADDYPKIRPRLQELSRQGIKIQSAGRKELERFVRGLVRISAENGMEIVSCAEEIDLQPYGVKPGKCVDDAYIKQVFGINVTHAKDPSQRKACGCITSKDIGAYDSCLFECQYCYATSSFARAKRRHEEHDPLSPSLMGHFDAPEKAAHDERANQDCPAVELPDNSKSS
jgi:hypothetical protein